MNISINSLQTRYILLAIIVSIVVVASVTWGNAQLSSTQQKITADLNSSKEWIEKVRRIRVHLLEAYRKIDIFLLEPELNNVRNEVFEHIDTADEVTEELQNSASSIPAEQKKLLISIHADLDSLTHHVKQLFDIRIDPAKQYPSMAVGDKIMQPNRVRFNNALTTAVSELEDEDGLRQSPDVYAVIMTTRHYWTTAVSNYRLYRANRVGSFDVNALSRQEEGIETLYKAIQAQLQILKSMDNDGRLGFETGSAVDVMLESGQKWYAGFQQSKKIHHSGEWRMDSKVMREFIAPLIDSISRSLQEIEHGIDSITATDIRLLTLAASKQNNIMWLLAGLSLLFIIIIVTSMQRMLIKPVMSVAQAMKLEAFGERNIELPLNASDETTDLIDAFGEMRKQVHNRQTELEHIATHDMLTSLPNRVLLNDRLENSLLQAQRLKKSLAILIIDLDQFKVVNDTLGHQAGDQLLIEAGSRFTSVLREVDTVARLGGDEFAILLPDATEMSVMQVAQKLSNTLEKDFRFNQQLLYIKASIGIALYPKHGHDSQSLLKHADIAMYHAKENNLGYALYNAKHDGHNIRHLCLIKDLHDAIENKLLELHYQPKVQMSNGDIIGVEALLRWNHPKFGYVPPIQIIEIAERTGQILPLTYWVIDHAFAQCSQWSSHGQNISMAINLSVFSLKDKKLVECLSKGLQKYDLSAQSICLEITESAMMSNPTYAIDVLTQIHSMGIRLSIDDFGTGFSSLAYLKQLPVDELKIDQSFIFDMTENNDDKIIVKSTIDLAHNLGLEVIAEGVETMAAWQMLQQMNCDLAQGYYLSKPLNKNDFSKWLANHPHQALYNDKEKAPSNNKSWNS